METLGMFVVLAGCGAAAFAAWGEYRFALIAPIATVLGIALVQWGARREIKASRARAQGSAATALAVIFIPAAIVFWMVVADDASTGAAVGIAIAYSALGVVYGAIAFWRALGVIFGWI